MRRERKVERRRRARRAYFARGVRDRAREADEPDIDVLPTSLILALISSMAGFSVFYVLIHL